MAVNISSDSKLTNRYQTTIPKIVREVLRLKKQDKIRYIIQSDGSVLISRASQDEEDPVIANFLNFLADDINKNPQHIKPINHSMLNRVRSLVSDVEIDLNSPLSDEDE